VRGPPKWRLDIVPQKGTRLRALNRAPSAGPLGGTVKAGPQGALLTEPNALSAGLQKKLSLTDPKKGDLRALEYM
jgi:hypothetical protein